MLDFLGACACTCKLRCEREGTLFQSLAKGTMCGAKKGDEGLDKQRRRKKVRSNFRRTRALLKDPSKLRSSFAEEKDSIRIVSTEYSYVGYERSRALHLSQEKSTGSTREEQMISRVGDLPEGKGGQRQDVPQTVLMYLT